MVDEISAKKMGLFESFKFINNFDELKKTYYWKGQGYGIYSYVDNELVPIVSVVSLMEAKHFLSKGIWIKV